MKRFYAFSSLDWIAVYLPHGQRIYEGHPWNMDLGDILNRLGVIEWNEVEFDFVGNEFERDNSKMTPEMEAVLEAQI
jgi:hypothetical protein